MVTLIDLYQSIAHALHRYRRTLQMAKAAEAKAASAHAHAQALCATRMAGCGGKNGSGGSKEGGCGKAGCGAAGGASSAAGTSHLPWPLHLPSNLTRCLTPAAPRLSPRHHAHLPPSHLAPSHLARLARTQLEAGVNTAQERIASPSRFLRNSPDDFIVCYGVALSMLESDIHWVGLPSSLFVGNERLRTYEEIDSCVRPQRRCLHSVSVPVSTQMLT